MDALVDKVCELERELENADQEIDRLESIIAEKAENELSYLKAINHLELKLTIEEYTKDRQILLSAQADLERRASSLNHENSTQAQTIATLKANLASSAESLAQHTQTARESAETIASLRSALQTQQESHKSALLQQQASLVASHSRAVDGLEEKMHDLALLVQEKEGEAAGERRRAERAEGEAEEARRMCRERVEAERERAAREVRAAREEAERRWGLGVEGSDSADRGVVEGRRIEMAEIEYRKKHLAALRTMEELFQNKLLEQVELVREKVTQEYTKVVDAISTEKSTVEAKAFGLEQRIFELECEIRKLEDQNTTFNHKVNMAEKELTILNDKLSRVLEERDQLYKQELLYQETNIRLKLTNEELGQLKESYHHLQNQYTEIESEKETLMIQIRAAQNTVAVERDRIEDERAKLFVLVEDSKNTINELQEKLFIKEKTIHQIRTEFKLSITQIKSKTTSILKSKLGELVRDMADQKQSLNLQSARFWQFCSQLLPKALKKYCDHLKSDYQIQMLEKLREFEAAAKQSQCQDKSKLFEYERKLQQKDDEISDLKEGRREFYSDYSLQMESVVQNYTEQIRQKASQLELAKEALHTLTQTNDNLESEMSRLKSDLAELRRKQQGWSEALVLNNTKFQTEIHSLKHENELLKKHNSTLHTQVEQRATQLHKTSRRGANQDKNATPCKPKLTKSASNSSTRGSSAPATPLSSTPPLSGLWGLGFGVWGLGFGVWGLGFAPLLVSAVQEKVG